MKEAVCEGVLLMMKCHFEEEEGEWVLLGMTER